jgi:AcrR family transcriptional regulator
LSPRLSAAERRERIERAATEVFAERGYQGASTAEIARRSGISVPVLYDHFPSKLELHRRLLERTRDELLTLWQRELFTDEPADVRIPRALDAWAGYVEANPYTARMFFRGPGGDPEAEAVHREVQAQARVALGVVLGREPGSERIGGQRELEMAAETMRSGLAGLAMWWSDHPSVPRQEVVDVAVAIVWTGFRQVVTPPGG